VCSDHFPSRLPVDLSQHCDEQTWSRFIAPINQKKRLEALLLFAMIAICFVPVIMQIIPAISPGPCGQCYRDFEEACAQAEGVREECERTGNKNSKYMDGECMSAHPACGEALSTWESCAAGVEDCEAKPPERGGFGGMSFIITFPVVGAFIFLHCKNKSDIKAYCDRARGSDFTNIGSIDYYHGGKHEPLKLVFHRAGGGSGAKMGDPV